jgi:hypothetical protein
MLFGLAGQVDLTPTMDVSNYIVEGGAQYIADAQSMDASAMQSTFPALAPAPVVATPVTAPVAPPPAPSLFSNPLVLVALAAGGYWLYTQHKSLNV